MTDGRREPIKPVNWNKIEDELDLTVWNKLTSQFWLDTKVPLSNDIPSWSTLTDVEKKTFMRVFAGLTMLDTIQSSVGAISLIPDSTTPHEEAVYTFIAAMESVHAKSYSSIFSTLASTPEIDEAFRWAEENEELQRKGEIVLDLYSGDDPLKRKIASTLLESFLFFSGFYQSLYWGSHGKLTNTADIIRLIIRDECLGPDHELLTPDGWKPIAEITEKDLVAQWHEDGTIDFAHPVKVSKHQAPVTYLFENEQGHVRQHVSPNHRMLLERRSYGRGSTDWTAEVTRAEELPATRLNPYARFINAGQLNGPEVSMTVEERLLVAIQADGCFDTTTVNALGEPRRSGAVTGTVPCTFTFSKAHKIERLIELADEAGWKLTHRGVRVGSGEIKDRQELILYVPVDFPRDKRLSSIVNLQKVGSRWCQEFIDELSLWDGHVVKENPARITWGSVIEDNAKFVQAAAALAGYRTHYRRIEDDRSETFSDYHRVQIHKELAHSGAQKVTKTELPGCEVYGVEVPSSFLLTRNGGSVTVTGNSVHGFYIGAKYQKALEKLSTAKREELKEYTYDLLMELYENEIAYTADLYDPVGLTEEVKTFLRYNANKALMNLGYDPLFPKAQTQVNPSIMSALSLESENHDFFSGSGSSYVMGKAEVTDDNDWDF